jgi:hypothetical protein
MKEREREREREKNRTYGLFLYITDKLKKTLYIYRQDNHEDFLSDI